MLSTDEADVSDYSEILPALRVIYGEHTQTQTKKTRLERIQNVKNAFKVSNPEKIENKHILLVDDVITTGATLEVCASTLLSVKNVRVSLVSLAYANG